MANMSGTEHAVELSKQMPTLAVGVHLTLTCGKPILGKKVSSLIRNDGNFYNLCDFESKHNIKKISIVKIDENELYDEWKTQIDKLYSLGIKLSHIDSHHHIHTFNQTAEIAKTLSKEYNLPVRNCNKAVDDNDINFLDLCNYEPIRDMSSKYISVREKCFEIIESNILKNIEFKKSEAMCHPAFIDSPLLEGSSFNIPRVREVDILCDPYMRELINKYDIELCNYNNI